MVVQDWALFAVERQQLPQGGEELQEKVLVIALVFDVARLVAERSSSRLDDGVANVGIEAHAVGHLLEAA